jgi:predicted DNA-binding transcriptional regulator YafY
MRPDPFPTPASGREDEDGLSHDGPPANAGNPKLQRWMDLLAALLARRTPATFDELAREVPAYDAPVRAAAAAETASDRKRRLDSAKRTFERDKAELRALGILIESVADEDGNAEGAYRLRRTEFYLPYLLLVAPGAAPPPAGGAGDAGADPSARTARHGPGYGYRTLATLHFEPDELQAVVDAAACARQLGDPILAAEAEHALRKLAFDLPATAADADGGSPAGGRDAPHVLLDRARRDAAAFESLSDALVRRKQVRFRYHAFGRDETAERCAEPWGLFFQHGHWYLAARDVDADALRNFRLSRIADPTVNTARAGSPDYEVPVGFRLRKHAASRQAWELGDSDAVTVEVAFRGETGPAMAARRLGTPVAERPDHRTFTVRRLDAFVRWLLGFAGEAMPVAPPLVVDAYRTALEEVAAALEAAPPAGVAEAAARPGSGAPMGGARSAAGGPVAPRRGGASAPGVSVTAAAQLRRLLQCLPLIADGEDHALAEVAHRMGTDRETLLRDLHALAARYDMPGGFVEGVSMYLEPDRVSARSGHFRRPMRLVASELCALSLGLSVLRHLRTPDEHAVLERARARLDAVVARLPDDPLPERHAATLGSGGDLAVLATVREGLRQRRVVRIAYRKSGAAAPDARDLHPYALVAAEGMLYLLAHCPRSDGLRVFRLDRIESAMLGDEQFALPPGFSVDAVLEDGRAFIAGRHDTLRVRYSPRIARWIAEREGVPLDADGSLTLAHPLADPEWALRHVLQYGPDATVLAPTTVRDALVERVAAMRAAVESGSDARAG